MKKTIRIKPVAHILMVGICSLIALVSCENDLTSFLFKDLFYEGWKVSAWSEAVPVVEGFTHLQGDDYSNGFPMNMRLGSNGKIHLIGFRVSATPFEWLYTTREPGADGFEQSYTAVSSFTENPDGFGINPAMDLISDDVPYIAYGVNDTLYFQNYDPIDGWDDMEPLYDPGTPIDYDYVFLFFFTSDLKTHLFFVADSTMYHTVRTGSSTIEPDPPEEYINDISYVTALRVGGNDAAFIYTDSSYQTLYIKTFSGTSALSIWSVPDSSLSIGGMSVASDSNGKFHVICTTFKTDDILNPAYYTFHYLRNTGGAWEERESITGTAESGPLAIAFPPAIDIAPDKHGNDHLHMAYTLYTPPASFPIWYAHYDEAEGWQVASESVDTKNTNTMWTFPLMAVDQEGVVHIVYSWAPNELSRTMMYVRGNPQESQ